MAEYLAGDVRKCREFAEVYGGNFYFGECGCCATETVSMRPYFWNNGKKDDGENQAKHLAAVIRAFSAEPWRLLWEMGEQNYRPQFHDEAATSKGIYD